MYSSRAPPPAVAGPPSDRQEYGISTIATPSGGNGLGADGSAAYDYEAKRQRLLHGGSAAASGMLNPFYQSQPLQSIPQISFSSPSNPTVAPPVPVLQSTFGTSLSSYYAAASPTPPSQHPDVPVAASGMYFPHGQHAPGANPNSASNPGSGYNIVSSAGANPNNVNSGSLYSSSAHPNPNYVTNAGRSLNPLLNTAYSSPGHIQSFPGAGSSVPSLSGASPYRADSPMSMPGNLNHHSAGSPATLPLPMMPFEQRSPHQTHSSPPSSFKEPGFNPFPAYSRFFPVVRIRGLPFNCSESDVYDFFEGLDVVDVLLTHRQGRFSGEAYCVFGLPMQVELALHRNRKCMGQRYIEVFRSKKHEYYLAIAAEVSEQEKVPTGELAPSYPLSKSTMEKEHMEHTGVLKLRGLPFSASKRDVIEFFKDFHLKDENIQFVVHSDGRASGEAFVEFDGPVLSKQAMVRDKMMLGSRYIELFPSSSEEASRVTGRHKK